MIDAVINKGTFEERLALAVIMLKKREIKKSYELIIEAMSLAPSSPEVHNLLGIFFDMNGNEDAARRHFRAAYALDPSFAPAAGNLEQLCRVNWEPEEKMYDFGDAKITGKYQDRSGASVLKTLE